MMMTWIVDGFAIFVDGAVFDFFEPFIIQDVFHCSSIFDLHSKHLGNYRPCRMW